MRKLLLLLVVVLLGVGTWAYVTCRHVVPAGTIGAWLGPDRLLIENLEPGTHWRRPQGGMLALFPEGLHSFTFPDDPDYVLFDADGAPVTWRVKVSYQVDRESVDFIVRQIPIGDDWDVTGVERWARAQLREGGRKSAAQLRTNIIERTNGRALGIALYSLLRTRGLEFQVTPEPLDAPSATPDAVHVILVGMDAGDWILLDPLLAEGRLPNLAALIKRGVRADLHTLTPMLSPLIWTSIATGVTPDQHGILDFLTQDPVTGARVPVSSSMRRAPAFWNFLTQHNVSQGIVGWLATWPAETVSGTLVTDRFGYLAYAATSEGSDQGMTWPPEFAVTARELQTAAAQVEPAFWTRFIKAPASDLSNLGAEGFGSGRLNDNLALSIRTALEWTRIAEAIQSEQSPRVLAVYYEMVDAVGHLVMPYAPPQRASISDADFATYGNTMDAAIELQDELLGRLLASRNLDNTIVMVVSDHGMKSGASRPEGSAAIEAGEAARWHRDPGIFIMAGPQVQPGLILESHIDVLDIAPTLLSILGIPIPESMTGQVITEAFTLSGRDLYQRVTATEDLRPEVWVQPTSVASAQGGPGVAAMHNNLGLVLESDGKLTEAAAEYRAALDAVPDDINARANLANVLRKQGKLEEAASLLKAVLADDPDYLPAMFNAAVVAQDQGQLVEAADGFRAVLEAEPGNLAARTNLGHCLLRLGQRADAAPLFEEVVEHDPRNANAIFGLGLVAAESGDYPAAEAAFARTLELDPNHAGAAQNLKQVRQLLSKP